MPRPGEPEETLDPENWDELRRLGHGMVDDMLDYLRTARSRPAWQPMPQETAARLKGPVPRGETDAAAVYQEFVRDVLPYPNGNTHPRFWGWVQGTGTPLAMLADMLASGLNPHMAGFAQAPAQVEETTVAWLRELLGLPEEASGLLTSGGTMANLIGLAVARHAALGDQGRATGLQDPACPRLVAYASTEVHGWARKAMELLGLGREALRLLPVDREFRLPPAAVEDAIRRDRDAGLTPFCLIATAGTVNTGAIDDLVALGALARKEDLWLHVDGAFGALARLSAEHAHLVKGIEAADSLAFDLHKWMYQPFEAGCILVRRPGMQRATFAQTAEYLAGVGRGVAPGSLQFYDLGVELSRSFKALKVWMALKTHGADKLGRIIGQNIRQAHSLAALIRETPPLELLAPVPLNVVCYRYAAPGLTDGDLDTLNQELLLRLQEQGIAVPSGTRIGGRFALRVAIVNHRSRWDDFEALVGATLRLGAELAAG